MLVTENNLQEISKIGRVNSVVSLVPSLTETIASLGAKNSLAGVTRFCKYPEGIRKEVAIVGGTKDFNNEMIISLKPDVVAAVKEENDETGILKLAEKLPVVLFDITHPEEAFDMMCTLGKLLDKEKEADRLVEEIKNGFAGIPEVLPRRKCLYLIWKKPWMAAGKETFINEMLDRFGFENVTEGRYPEVSKADFDRAEFLLLSSEPYPFKQKHRRELQQQFPGKKVWLVDGEIFSWYGSRMLKAGEYFKQLVTML
jgi:ABC-type Fe3+-hydroxamate transport system substrate-binding protein